MLKGFLENEFVTETKHPLHLEVDFDYQVTYQGIPVLFIFGLLKSL